MPPFRRWKGGAGGRAIRGVWGGVFVEARGCTLLNIPERSGSSNGPCCSIFGTLLGGAGRTNEWLRFLAHCVRTTPAPATQFSRKDADAFPLYEEFLGKVWWYRMETGGGVFGMMGSVSVCRGDAPTAY